MCSRCQPDPKASSRAVLARSWLSPVFPARRFAIRVSCRPGWPQVAKKDTRTGLEPLLSWRCGPRTRRPPPATRPYPSSNSSLWRKPCSISRAPTTSVLGWSCFNVVIDPISCNTSTDGVAGGLCLRST